MNMSCLIIKHKQDILKIILHLENINSYIKKI